MKLTKKITIVTGHFGSGKTNFSVNLARENAPVTLIDLDIVNPYFRTADFIGKFEGVNIIAPEFANSNVDLPYLGGFIDAAFEADGPVIVDVGGDDAGATPLGMYRETLVAQGYEMLSVISKYRPLTATPEDCLQYLKEIEAACGLFVTGLVNNSNIGPATTEEDVRESVAYAKKVSELCGVPLLCTTADRRLEGTLGGIEDLMLVDVLVKTIWDKEE